MKEYIIILKDNCPIELRQDLETLLEIFQEENYLFVDKYKVNEVNKRC